MNPHDWEAIQTLQRNLVPTHQNDVNNSMENASVTNNEWDTLCKYLRHTIHEAQSGMGEDVGRRRPPSPNLCIRGDSEVEDPDVEPIEMDKEDPELSRKRKELREIEERIILKKAALALKAVEPSVTTTAPEFPCNEQSASCKGATLKDRVNVILQQRHPASFLSKVRSPREGMKSLRLQQDDHPLKLRVKALMKQRCSDPFDLPASREVPDVTPPPPSRSVTSPAKKENGFNQGFQRFLSVLNEGVDMDFLSRIVTDDSVGLPLGEERVNTRPPAVENKSDPPFRRESQQSNSGASLPGRSRTHSGDGKTDPPSQERSLPLPDDDTKKNDRGDRSFASCSRSKSPSAVKKKKKKKEEEKPKVDEQREQLQNILKTLGLSLEVEEMSKLADRTQERLYGKKHEDTGADGKEEQESRQSASQRHYGKSSSSSSSSSSSCSSSSSRSTSRSFSRSPSHRRRSLSRDLKRRSEHSHSRDRSRDGPTCQDGKEAQMYRDEDRMDPKEISPYQYPYPQNQVYPHPQPAAFSAFPGYSVSQDSQYTAYYVDTHSAATNSYWTHTQGAVPSSYYPSGNPYPQNNYHHFPDSVAAPNMVYPHQHSLDFNLLVNPDLSTSEGQTGSASGPRCLQEIATKQPANERCLHRLTKGPKRKGKLETRLRNWRIRWKKKKMILKQLKVAAKQSVNLVEKVEAPQLNVEESEQSEEEKQPPTEEEIKANLRKTLEAFNQKVKQKAAQPAKSLT